MTLYIVFNTMRMSILFAIYSSQPGLLMLNVSVIFINLHNPLFFITVYLLSNVCISLKEESNHKVGFQDSSVLICPNLKFSDSGSKHLYFPHLKQTKMCRYNFQLAIQRSNKHLWWSTLVQQLTLWHQELHLRCS